MPKFGKSSMQRRATCHPDLQIILDEAIKHIDFTILDGHRTEEAQNKAFSEGKSQLRYPQSKHNSLPSGAFDIAPYPIDWNNLNRFYLLAGVVIGIARQKGVNIRWGGSWDNSLDITKNKFNDLVHFEFRK